jgi:hypothetical protein
VCDVHVGDLGKYSKIVDDRAHWGRLADGEWILESYGSQSQGIFEVLDEDQLLFWLTRMSSPNTWCNVSSTKI